MTRQIYARDEAKALLKEARQRDRSTLNMLVEAKADEKVCTREDVITLIKYDRKRSREPSDPTASGLITQNPWVCVILTSDRYSG